jgi:dihydroorotase
VHVLAYGSVSASRAGEQLAALGELADAGVAGFTDDPSPIRSASVLRSALSYAGALGVPVVDHPTEPPLTEGAEANDGVVATILGLRGSPAAAEEIGVARDIAVLADVVRDVPSARLHLAHLSTRAALDLVRRAKAAGLPVTCHVTAHHVALTDEWLAGSRAWAWEAQGDRSAEPFDSSLRVDPPLRTADDVAACLDALADGTADAIATDHGPHSVVDKDVEFGLALAGISGIETALGLVLEAVDAGRLPLVRAIAALTAGPAAVLAERLSAQRGLGDGEVLDGRRGLAEGQPADLVVFDRGARWTVGAETLASQGKNTPLIGRDLPGRVLLTVAGGRVAYVDT